MASINQPFNFEGMVVTPYHLLSPEKLLTVLSIRNHDRVRIWMDNQSPIEADEHMKFVREISHRDDCAYFAVESNGVIIGAVYLTSINIVGSTAELGLFRDPAIKMRGVGSALLRIVESLATRVGFRVLTLRVRCDNERAVALYRKAGYVQESGSDTYYEMIKRLRQ